ncbi:hypothetical protein ROK90_06495 [Cronobacter dublinensis]|uniref:hypothetical protein n=1 Tax=Cronobacter dublinensis TaxID=413497 RepID=UPI0023DD2C22|nr:hypothetical protein [Cronobacter dublinensis]MDT3665665.1 hypothetical protein [Cronobacter dublinensis]WEP46999.1 hypothetical protein NNQ27_08940 [Cronobacter dublinensis]
MNSSQYLWEVLSSPLVIKLVLVLLIALCCYDMLRKRRKKQQQRAGVIVDADARERHEWHYARRALKGVQIILLGWFLWTLIRALLA